MTEPTAPTMASPKPQFLSKASIHLILLCIVSLLVFLPGLNSYGFADPGDGVYAEGAREMFERGDMVTPSYNYKPFFEKPILIYWMIMAWYRILGVHEVVARLPVALCGAATAIAFLLFTRRFLGNRGSFFAALSLLSMPLFVGTGRLAITDVPLTLFMMLGILGLFSRLRGGHWTTLAIGYIGLGLAFLTKGLLPVFLVVLLISAYMVWISPKKTEQEGAIAPHQWWWRNLNLLHPLLGAVVVFSVAAPWFFVVSAKTNGAFMHEFFTRQVFGFAGGDLSQQNPFWFYLPVFFGGFFPWSIFVLFEIPRLIRLFKRKVLTERAHLELFSVIWIVLVIAVFSLMPVKLLSYAVPVAPALAVLAGSMFDRLIRRKKAKLVGWILLPLLLIVLPGSAYFAAQQPERIGVDFATLCAFAGFGFFIWMLLAFAASSAFKKRTEAAITCIACACLFGAATFVPTGLQFYWVRNGRPLYLLLRDAVANHCQVALYMKDTPAAVFFLKRPVLEIHNEKDLKLYVEHGYKPHLILITSDLLAQMKEQPANWILVSSLGKWNLVKVDPD